MEEVFVKLTHSLTAWNLIAVSAKYRILNVRNTHFSNGIVLFSLVIAVMGLCSRRKACLVFMNKILEFC